MPQFSIASHLRCNLLLRPLRSSIDGLLRPPGVWEFLDSQTFWRVIIPLSIPGIVAGMVLSFAHTLGEFGVVLMVGGNLPGITRTVSISIYDEVQALNYDLAGQTSLLLLCFSFVVLVVTYGLQRRVSTGWPTT